MAYIITKSDSTTLIPGGLTDGTIDQSHTSLTLVGKDYPGYGQFLNENFVYLLENFAKTSGPANPLVGQLWFDKTNNILRVWSGTSWKISTGATASPYSLPPTDTSSLGGDLWFDTTNQQLKVFNGAGQQWITIGPVATSATGNSGAVPATFVDTGGSSHVVVQILIYGIVYAVFSKDTFNTNISGFATVNAGINFNTTVSPNWGISSIASLTTNSLTSASITSAGISVTNNSSTTSITPTTITTTILNVPTLTASSISVGNTVVGINAVTTGTVNASAVNVSGSLVPTANLGVSLGASGAWFNNIYGSAVIASTVNVGASLLPLSNVAVNIGSTSSWFNNIYANAVNVGTSLLPLSNVAVNIGSTSSWFNNIYGTAIHAQYADLAERFESDAEYEPGTVVEIGGPAEITKVSAELSDNVFGVISTKAAYLMNSRAGTDATHPPIAVQGRVPVRVTGIIRKGDRLVSAGNGMARAGSKLEISTWNVIGRALENKTNDGEGIIEAVVKLNS